MARAPAVDREWRAEVPAISAYKLEPLAAEFDPRGETGGMVPVELARHEESNTTVKWFPLGSPCVCLYMRVCMVPVRGRSRVCACAYV